MCHFFDDTEAWKTKRFGGRGMAWACESDRSRINNTRPAELEAASTTLQIVRLALQRLTGRGHHRHDRARVVVNIAVIAIIARGSVSFSWYEFKGVSFFSKRASRKLGRRRSPRLEVFETPREGKNANVRS